MNKIKYLNDYIFKYSQGNQDHILETREIINSLDWEDLKVVIQNNLSNGYLIFRELNYKLDNSFFDLVYDAFLLVLERWERPSDYEYTQEYISFHIYRDILIWIPKYFDCVEYENEQLIEKLEILKDRFQNYQNVTDCLNEKISDLKK